jgi:hypothetical protein
VTTDFCDKLPVDSNQRLTMSQNVVLTRSQLAQIPLDKKNPAPKPPARSRAKPTPPVSPESDVSLSAELGDSFLSSTAVELNTTQPTPQPKQKEDVILDTLNEIKLLVAGLDLKFTTNINDLRLTVASVKDEVAAVRLDVSSLIATQITEHDKRLDGHDNRLDAVEASIRELRNNAEAATKTADLIIKGVPMLSNENPVKIYVDIAAAIGYDSVTTPSAENIIRLGKKKTDGKFDPPLLVKFVRTSDKVEFFRRYFQHKHLNLSEIGFNARQRIYITENLTKQDQEIHAAALKLRHERKLFSVSTLRGVVMVRRSREDRPVPVKAVSELQELLDDGAKQDDDADKDGQD